MWRRINFDDHLYAVFFKFLLLRPMSKNSLRSGIFLVAVHKVNIQSHPDIALLYVYRSLWRDIEVLCNI